MLQHRHVYPGLNNDEPCGWHDAARVHTKYPTAHDNILEEREFTPGTRAKKAVTPVFSFNEYGEQVIPAPLTEGELFAREVEAAMKEVTAVINPKVQAMIDADPALIGYPKARKVA